MGERSTWTADIDPGFIDYNPENNKDTLRQIVTNAYDPNDKQVVPAGETEFGRIALEDSILHYRIRFQNTGTYYAYNVFIRDTIEEDLDIGSVEITGYSHPMNMEILDDRTLLFRFDNIMLPDSNLNEPESHGYVSYSIEARDDAYYGLELTNKADIYFDYNDPVATNTTLNTYYDLNTLRNSVEVDAGTIEIWPNPAKNGITVQLSDPGIQYDYADIFNTGGKLLASFHLKGSELNYLPLGNLENGFYILVVRKGNQVKGRRKLIITRE